MQTIKVHMMLLEATIVDFIIAVFLDVVVDFVIVVFLIVKNHR